MRKSSAIVKRIDEIAHYPGVITKEPLGTGTLNEAKRGLDTCLETSTSTTAAQSTAAVWANLINDDICNTPLTYRVRTNWHTFKIVIQFTVNLLLPLPVQISTILLRAALKLMKILCIMTLLQ
jgi:hypothetical protein